MMFALLLLFFQQPVPEFVHGEECLFCHRNDIGSAWQKNVHGTTVNEKQGSDEFSLGSRNQVRRLRKSGYNQFEIFDTGGNSWDKTKFADRCAGCHTTAFDASTKTFAYYGLDCFTCHGVVDLNHTGDTSLILLSKKRRNETKVVTSICASCHLRNGTSATTKLPFPNLFIPGGNLFQDFQVDLKLADDAALNPGDRHVYRSVRDVTENGATTTCLSCHSLHGNSTDKHRRVLSSPICLDCHFDGRPRKEVVKYIVRSAICEY
ncbi:MAG: hypothetical protein JJE04_10130 [Acidobacteriia bacterium]|nr:hypothetical protein [Terriglobia bacterium]